MDNVGADSMSRKLQLSEMRKRKREEQRRQTQLIAGKTGLSIEDVEFYLIEFAQCALLCEIMSTEPEPEMDIAFVRATEVMRCIAHGTPVDAALTEAVASDAC